MKTAVSERVDNTVNSGGVKLHIFQPSGRKLWTVVGKDNEQWADLRSRILLLQKLLL